MTEPLSSYQEQVLSLLQTGVSAVVVGVAFVIFLLAVVTVRHL